MSLNTVLLSFCRFTGFRPALIFCSITTLVVAAHAIMRDPHHVAKHGSVGARHGGSSDSDEEDDNGNVKPTKDRRRSKIDGLVSAIIAIHAMQCKAPLKPLVYEQAGMLGI